MSGAAWRRVVALALSVISGSALAFDSLPADGKCEYGKAIERALGSFAYRVVVSGGYEGDGGRPVKVQLWQNDDRDWVITEAFLKQNRTCVVRSGVRLHMLY